MPLSDGDRMIQDDYITKLGGPIQTGLVMDLATALSTRDDFLLQADVQTPMPYVGGALETYAKVAFRWSNLPAAARAALDRFSPSVAFPADLMVTWTVGARDGVGGCSLYWDPASPWYNTFYGAYGVRSHKADGAPWGFMDEDGKHPDVEEMLRVPEFDYNFLTAAQLGCPPEKQSFDPHDKKLSTVGDWFVVDVDCTIPSGLHRPLGDPLSEDGIGNLVRAATKGELLDTIARRASVMYQAYRVMFGAPDASYLVHHDPYEPVEMRGSLYFRSVQTRTKDPITLAWGAMCPVANGGPALCDRILDVMKKMYLPG
jgi:hypothetical protein